MGLPYKWLVSLNRGYYKYQPPRDDPVEYSRWEYEEGKKVWERFFRDRVSLEGKDVLDLGCGPGGKTCYLASFNPNKIVGVDFNASYIQQADHAKNVLASPECRMNIEFAVVDASDLPFPDSWFDVITCSDAFEHFENPLEVMASATRVLKPGGKFTIDFAQWGAYNGHHLGDFLKTWWPHVFWSHEAVKRAVGELASEASGYLDQKSMDNLTDLVRRRLDQFEGGLNRLSITGFEKIISSENGLRIIYSKKTTAHPLLWPFIHIPGVRELAVARNIYILEAL